jgi:hypothetical protein
MHHIDLADLSGRADGHLHLYLAERTCGSLLVLVSRAPDAEETEPLAAALTAEGWHVLDVRLAADGDVGAATILHALKDATARLLPPSAGRFPVILIADSAAVLPACIAVRQSHRQAEQPVIGGVAMVDGFENAGRQADDAVSKLAGIEDLAVLVAAYRGTGEGRRAGLSYHRHLQQSGRESHFIVLPREGPSPHDRLADPRDPFGREIRWLLGPVNSRTLS